MAVKKTRRKLFKVAKELNLSHQTIEEFLQKKGHEVQGLNTPISDEVYDEILSRFSQEKVKADKLEKRRQERIKEIEASEVATAEAAHDELVQEPTEQGDEEPLVIEDVALPEEEVIEDESVIAAKSEADVMMPDHEIEEEVKAGDADAAAGEGLSETEPSEKTQTEASAEQKIEAVEADTETEVEPEAETEEYETVEEEAIGEETDEGEAEEEQAEERPQIGDIVEHPGAKRYLERKRLEEEKKIEKKRKRLKEIKEKKEEKAEKEAPNTDKIAARKNEKEIAAEIIDEDEELTAKGKAKKGKKKKEVKEDISDKEKRRRKALEMIRREGRKTRVKMPATGLEELTEEEAKRETGKKRSKKKKEIDEQEVEDTLKKTLASIRDTSVSKRKRRKVRDQAEDVPEEDNVIAVSEFITVQDLANLMSVPVADVIKKCMDLGQLVTINQRLDMDMIRLLAEDFGYKVQEEEEFASDYIEELVEDEERPEDLKPRHPVVTVMGHVDHGKTSLLDYIRKENVVAGESGGITQHIGAYVVDMEDNRKITFLDTPGHEAFTAMRARGAQVTDLVVLVVAADDRVMPQTEEAIDHARAANVPIVIAINKVDKPNANPQAIRKQLADRNILVEDWGGKYQVVEVSAKTGQGIPDLLEKILLEAELMDLKANPQKKASGVVVESRLDKGKGPVATILVQHGTLKVGDSFLVGQYWGKVRALQNDRNQRVDEAGPAYPVQVLGIDGVPEAGDKFLVMSDEKEARDIAQRRQQLKREQDFRQVRLVTLDEISRQIAEGEVKELNLLVKADVDGSAQALTDSLLKLSTQDVAVKVIRRAVGPITESDVLLAAASNAIIIGFHVRPSIQAKELAESEKVDIRLYKVIYDATEDVTKALEGLLEPEEREQVLGMIEVREVFKISRVGTVAGGYVLNGKVNRNNRIRLIRNDVEIYEGRLSSLKRFKDDVREVGAGYECGLMIENYNDIKVGDNIEAFEIVQEKRTLA